MEKCNNCGKPKNEHTVAKQECPIGKKHRSLGYTQFGPATYEPIRPPLTNSTEEGHSAYKGVDVEVERLIQDFVKWKHCMSYNDSYFGEPAGELKRIAYQLDRLTPSTSATDPLQILADEAQALNMGYGHPKEQAEPVAWVMVTPIHGNRIYIDDAAEARRFAEMGDRSVTPLFAGSHPIQEQAEQPAQIKILFRACGRHT